MLGRRDSRDAPCIYIRSRTSCFHTHNEPVDDNLRANTGDAGNDVPVTILLGERYCADRVAEAEDSSLASIHRGADQASIPIGDGRLRAGILP
ncbi:hypothetical protein PGT21_019480 [Puccinia graminis f. sp. tritici]|uniref:Uncharacterized protein n=1 Tax=Puccinia graminis f. sp. tritici TaxID=56615 RepID=A0A5B0Q614_PUCGR|nr:hypothetical protein PGT21_019480 [Puccinia graminis f. sp. tritici]